MNPQIFKIQSNERIVLNVWENDPQAVTIIFYPGTMATPCMYPTLLNQLHNLGCNVVAIHPLSHGLSSKVRNNFTFDDILRNGLDAQAFAKKHFNGPIVVCGHSQGGILSIAHAIDNTEIKATFPIGTILPQRPDAIELTRFGFLRNNKDKLLYYLQKISAFAPTFPIPFFAYLSIAKLLDNAYKVYAPRKNCRLTYPLRYIYSLFSKDLSKACQMGSITCPVVLITSKNDTLFPHKMMQETLNDIEAKQKKLITIAGGGHLAAVSKYYAKHIAAHIAAECAGLGLQLHIKR